MNRIEMAEQIALRVPILAERDREEWKETEKNHRRFVSDYSPRKIAQMQIDDFVIGKGRDNKSFCYRLERELDKCGRILGATAAKFGVYYGKTKSDRRERYRHAAHWGDNYTNAFENIKTALVQLLNAASIDDMAAIKENKISPCSKGSFFSYTILINSHLFTQNVIFSILFLNLTFRETFDSEVAMQKALMEYRASWPELKSQPIYLYMRFLYDVFGYPSDSAAVATSTGSYPILSDAMEGAAFIDEMPPMPRTNSGRGASGPADFERRQRQLRRIGDRGEAIVLELEKRRLIDAGKRELARRIVHESQRNAGSGYDILSFDEDGSERPIEVKSTSAGNLSGGFYISSNGLDKSESLVNYHIYVVFRASSKSPRVLPLRRPSLKSAGYELRPINYQ